MSVQTVRVSVPNPDELLLAGFLGAGAKIHLERSATGGGLGFSEITTISIVTATYSYTYYDSGGSSTSWYRSRYTTSDGTTKITDYSAESRASTETFTSLAVLRGYLNDELAVPSDSDTSPWTPAFRSRAVSVAYATLWLRGVWKSVTVDLATVSGQQVYTPTGIRTLERAGLYDSTGALVEDVGSATLRDEGGTYTLNVAGLGAGYTLRLFGWTAYKSLFTGDGDTDDLDPDYNYVPILKAKAICYRQQLSKFVRYGSRQAIAPEMNVSAEQLLALESAALREFEVECKSLADRRPRIGKRIAGWRG